MPPRIAVVIAVYNDAHHLPTTLEALCRQTLQDFELTVYDDGSTDGSSGLVEEYAGRLPLRIVRAAHLGLPAAKIAAAEAAPKGAPYLMILDADIELPSDALARMVAELDDHEQVAAVSCHARAAVDRPFGVGQAFWDDLFQRSNTDEAGNARWVVGACVMLRRSAREGLGLTGLLSEDSELALKLREHWRLRAPRDLVAIHHGVPTTFVGLFRRGIREGARVRALLRAYPSARQLGNIARLVPLPLVAVGGLGAVTLQPWLTAGAGLLLGGYLASFLIASRHVPASTTTRLIGALTFTYANVGFGIGYLGEALRPDRGVRRHDTLRSS